MKLNVKMLLYARDLHGLAYLALQPALVAWQWFQPGFHPLAYALTLVLAVGITSISHNHAHLPMWSARVLNALTDHLLSLLQGHPVYVFRASHVASHHRHLRAGRDTTAPARFRDDNCLRGLLCHPIEVLPRLLPVFCHYLAVLRARRPAAFRHVLMQYALVLGTWGICMTQDPARALLLVIVPQLFALHFLLATNYLQHAHTQSLTRHGHSRNFLGLVNTLYFNIGFHTAHHERHRLHWSLLPSAHAAIRSRIPNALIERSLANYCLRTFLLEPLSARVRALRAGRTAATGKR